MAAAIHICAPQHNARPVTAGRAFNHQAAFGSIISQPIRIATMATAKTKKVTTIKLLAAKVQGKAKSAYTKGSAVVGEVGGMTKGNVAAVVQSGKILGLGLKEMGEGSVAEGRQAFETLTADVKAFAAIKSPAELLQLQFKLMQRNMDAAFALGAKNGKAIAKLASDAAAPLSEQVKANVAKVRKAA
jgi:hypothetical protein